MRSTSLAIVSVAVLAVGAAWAQENNPARRSPASAVELGTTPRMIVKFRSSDASGRVQVKAVNNGERASGLATRIGFAVRDSRALPSGLQLLSFDSQFTGESFAEQLERVRADSDVEFAEPDRRRYVQAVPNDPLYAGQWYLQNRFDTPSAINAEAAWDLTTGDPGVVVAVIDTGVLADHPDLKRMANGGRILPGYDFVANVAAANDGDGRDADPSDPGDWVTQAEATTHGGQFENCSVSNSSWHGTRVAGIIGALANNSEGIAGGTWSPWILPVRAIGKCGGFDSDILQAMAWAGGLPVPGVPNNPFPARVENMSLGSVGPCSTPYLSVVSELAAHGVLVVVSAGNEGGPVAAPANCKGVAAVAGLRHAGTKVGFSSLGPEVAVGAPGGNCVNVTGGPCVYSIDTTANDGTTTPGAYRYTNQTNANVGTSFSAPIVSGIVALMTSVNGNLDPAHLILRLREGARTPFPVSSDPTIPMCHVPTGVPTDPLQTGECNCTTSTCGAGMANALGAVNAALRPIAAITSQTAVVSGQSVALSGASSVGANGRTIATHLWTMACGGGAPTNSGGATTSVTAPSSGSITVQLAVTDDAGRQDTARLVVTSTSAAPPPAGSNGCPPVNVTVSPVTTNVNTAATQAFGATVANAQATGVTWQVNGVTGGNATVGTISTAGLYTAPAVVPSPATVTVTATSVEDSTRSGSAQLTVTAPPPPPSSGGGGGAGLDLLFLLCVLTGFMRLAPSMLMRTAPAT